MQLCADHLMLVDLTMHVLVQADMLSPDLLITSLLEQNKCLTHGMFKVLSKSLLTLTVGT